MSQKKYITHFDHMARGKNKRGSQEQRIQREFARIFNDFKRDLTAGITRALERQQA
jgi:hypothetical protein